MKNENNKKIITLSFVVAAFLVAFVVNVLMESVSAAWGGMARVMAYDAVAHGVPVGLGLACFIALQFNKNVVVWADEVVTEISRVVWPSPKDTTAMTIVVCVMLVIAGFSLGLMDLLSNAGVKWLVEVGKTVWN